MASVAAVFDQLDPLADRLTAWDELAVAAARPLAAPAWVTAWWAHMRPVGASMRTIAVFDGDELIGILPLSVTRRGVRPAGGDLITVEPLAAVGREAEVASAIAGGLGSLDARSVPLDLELQDDSPPWVSLLSEGWPGRGPLWHRASRPVSLPRIDLASLTFDEWMAGKSSNFRRDVRKKGRRLEADGGTFRLTTEGSLRADVAAFLLMHRGRHGGDSNLESDGVEDMLVRIAKELLPSGRFRLVCLDADGAPAAALLLSAAGTEVNAWSSGFSELLARHSPIMQCFVYALKDMAERGESTMRLGPGDQAYKLRLATDEGHLTRYTLVPPGRGHLRSRVRIAAKARLGGLRAGVRANAGRANALFGQRIGGGLASRRGS